MWNKWNQYDCVKAVWSRLEQAGLEAQWVELLEERCIFEQVNNHHCIQHMYNFALAFFSDAFTKVVDSQLLNLLFFEAIKLCVPLKNSDADENKDAHWCFDKDCSVNEGVGGFTKPMGGSVVYKRRSESQ